MLAFARFYHLHHGENSPENLLAAYFRWQETDSHVNETARRLMLIERTVVEYYGLLLEDVRGKRRFKELVRARQMIAYFAVLHAPQNMIQRSLGMNRNNVQYSKTKCGELLGVERQLRRERDEIRQRLEPLLAGLQIGREEREKVLITNTDDDENVN